MVVVTSDPFGWVSVFTSVFLTVGVGMTSLASLLSGVMAGKRLVSLCDWSTDDDTGTDLFGFFGTTGWRKGKKGFSFLEGHFIIEVRYGEKKTKKMKGSFLLLDKKTLNMLPVCIYTVSIKMF